MASETLMTGSIVIRSPLLEVFDYVADPDNLPEWVPLYSDIKVEEARVPGCASKGDCFSASLSLLPPAVREMLPFADYVLPFWGAVPPYGSGPRITVSVDDVVHGRRLSYRANTGWTTICDFEPSVNSTILSVTQSLWSLPGLLMSYWIGPLQAMANDMTGKVLEGLKRRLEGRAVEPKPKVFFSYRRSDARYVGGRIFDALTAEFGLGTVFRDSNSLLAGGKWADQIDEAIRGCRVVVVHMGDGWETTLLDRARGGQRDGLRDELEAALSEGEKIRLAPVLTSNRDNFNVGERMAEIAAAVQSLGDKAPHIMKTFTAELQVPHLREDPDFKQDLEHLMRAVWREFRSDA
jgi:hypothetical protein